MQTEALQTLPQIFLFVNSGSGGGVGNELLGSNTKQLTFTVPRSQRPADKAHLVTITINLFNMRDQEQRNSGFQQLASRTTSNAPSILVICGGDGTVMWVVTEMSSFNIDHTKVPIAIIPLGTGNDFARVLGWGEKSPDLLSDNFAKLKKRVTYWLSAQSQNLDIWMVEAEVQDYGKFQKVENCETKVFEGKQFSKHFCNYFSLGIDGKIGYSFDLHRTGSRMGNLAVYGTMGLVKSFTKTKTLGELTAEFKEMQPINIEDIKPKLEETKNKMQNIKLDENNTKAEESKEGKLPANVLQQGTVKVILKKGTETMEEVKDNQNLLFININSFMAGIKEVWNNAKLPQHLKESDFTPPSHSDGKIEIVSFGSAWSLGFQKAVGGRATRVHQGCGPFELLFNKYPEDEKHRTYMQIDGQFVRFTHPKSLAIKKSNLTMTGQIKVLRRVPLEAQKNCCTCI